MDGLTHTKQLLNLLCIVYFQLTKVSIETLLTDYSAHLLFIIKNEYDMPISVGFINIFFRFFTYNM